MCNHTQITFSPLPATAGTSVAAKSITLFSVLFSLLFLASCSHHSRVPYFEKYDWQAEGKLAIRASDIDGGKNSSLSYRWRQRDEAAFIEFISPLGQRLFYIEKYAGQVILHDAAGQTLGAENLSDLALNQLGVNLPLDNVASFMFEVSSAEAASSLQDSEWSVGRVDYIEGRLRKLILLNSTGTKLIILVKSFEQTH